MKEIRFLMPQLSQLPDGFISFRCCTCVGYTNMLADVTVDYTVD